MANANNHGNCHLILWTRNLTTFIAGAVNCFCKAGKICIKCLVVVVDPSSSATLRPVRFLLPQYFLASDFQSMQIISPLCKLSLLASSFEHLISLHLLSSASDYFFCLVIDITIRGIRVGCINLDALLSKLRIHYSSNWILLLCSRFFFCYINRKQISGPTSAINFLTWNEFSKHVESRIPLTNGHKM